MKYGLVLFGLLLSCGLAYGQFGNEWIQYNQAHWKIQVSEDGLYRLSYDDLLDAGVISSATLTSEIKLYNKGQLQHLWFDDGGDGTFHSGDSFTFLGLANDGQLDAQIYDVPANQLNANYSLFNDTACYFLSRNILDPSYTQTVALGDADAMTPLPYAWETSRVDHTSSYLIGEQDQNSVSLPIYQQGEGWAAPPFGMGGLFHTYVPTPDVYEGADAPLAEINAVSAGASLADGNPNHHLQVGWGSSFNLAIDSTFYGYQKMDFAFDLPVEELSDLTRITHKSINDLGLASDFQAVSHVEIRYPREWTPEENWWEFEVEAAPTDDFARIDIAIGDGSNPLLFVIRNDLQSVLETSVDGDILTARVPLTGGKAKLLLTSSDLIQDLSTPVPVTESGMFTNYSAQALDSAFLMIAPKVLVPAGNSYRFYKEGMGENVLLAEAEELYMQYAWGIGKHPLAFRNFCNHLLNAWDNPPAHLFLIGKSVHEMDISAMDGGRQHPEVDALNLLPTWGWPASDLAITSGLGSTLYEPAIPTGRIAARTTEEVLDYLNKVMDFEAAPPADWQKRILHFGGGGSFAEQNVFRNYLEQYELVVENSQYGGFVHEFYKSNTDPIQLQLGDSITDLISNGCGLMTFFGHASATGFDQNIDSPSNYSNQGRYPLLIGNSCYTGNIHLAEASSTSEMFTRVADAGVIGFIAKGDLGIPGYLNIWTRAFYESIFEDNYGQSIGQAMQFAASEAQGNGNVNLAVNHAMAFALHGDPSLLLYAREKADFSIDVSSISTLPEIVNTEVDSFDVQVVVTNLGRVVPDAFGIELIRTLPSGRDTSLLQSLSGLSWKDTVRFRLPVDPVDGVGSNLLDVLVDYPAGLVEEEDDIINNVVNGWEFTVESSDLIPVWPYPYMTTPDPVQQLTASTGEPHLEDRTYRFQLDTSPDFDSPALQEYQVDEDGGVIRWEGLSLNQETVYYWRVARSIAGEEPVWRESSFYTGDAPGFGQFAPGQYRNNSFKGLSYDEVSNALSYSPSTLDLSCTVYGNPNTAFETLATSYQLGLEVQDYAGCAGTPSIHVAVMDASSLEPWLTNHEGLYPENDFGNYMGCSIARDRPEAYFIFRQNNADEMQALQNLLDNEVPEGNHLLAYTWMHTDLDSWDANAPGLYDSFTNLGAGLLTQTDSVPFVFYTQVGNPASSQELVGMDIEDLLELELSLTGTSGEGSMTTPALGSSNDWLLGGWQFQTTETSDSLRISFETVNTTGQSSTLFTSEELSGSESLAAAPEDVDYMRIKAQLVDEETGETPSISQWYIQANLLPDAAVFPLTSGTWEISSEVQEGAQAFFAVGIENPTPYPLDSLLVKWWVERNGIGVREPEFHLLPPLDGNDFTLDTLGLHTEGLTGNYLVRVELNPFINGEAHQGEQHRFNNQMRLPLNVTPDVQNPLLDVSFDGRHIVDGEIVSAKPEVLISLMDENPFLLMDELADTSHFKIFLNNPDFSSTAIYFDQEALHFIPQAVGEKRAQIEWMPEFEQDGRYELIVQASDISGNTAGMDYRIHFEVITESSITEVLNYPNPFTTSTRFVFTLTGDSPPDELRIQILTVSGRVVREISQAELGSIRIGPNITDYAWDGRDEFGDPLATGVYLYRVIARDNGQDLKTRGSGADDYFKEGLGKMFLIRN